MRVELWKKTRFFWRFLNFSYLTVFDEKSKLFSFERFLWFLSLEHASPVTVLTENGQTMLVHVKTRNRSSPLDWSDRLSHPNTKAFRLYFMFSFLIQFFSSSFLVLVLFLCCCCCLKLFLCALRLAAGAFFWLKNDISEKMIFLILWKKYFLKCSKTLLLSS